MGKDCSRLLVALTRRLSMLKTWNPGQGDSWMRDRTTERREARRELLSIFAQRQMEAGKWLLASLLIVNGGAVVALMSNAVFGAEVLREAGLWFVIGVITAFFSGGASWALSNTYLLGLRQTIDVKFYKNEIDLNSHDIKSQETTFSLLMIGFGACSLVSFCVGAGVAIWKLPIAPAALGDTSNNNSDEVTNAADVELVNRAAVR